MNAMRKQFIKREPESSRKGFTLLELLMVIAIIGVLMSLTFYVLNGVTEGAEKEATTTTIHKINRLLEQRIEAFDRAFKGSRRNEYIKSTVGLLATTTDGRFDYFRVHPEDAPPAIVILARKAAFRSEFPQRMVELADGNGNGMPDVIENKIAIPNARTFLISANQVSPTPTPTFEPELSDINSLMNARWAGGSFSITFGVPPNTTLTTFTFVGNQQVTDSSELLYYTLVAAGSFGSSSVDADQFSDREIVDTDDDGLPEFVDAWQQPLRFYRWPTRLIDRTAPDPFEPDFAAINDNTEVDLTPDGDESDELREVTAKERTDASNLIRGLPASPLAFAGLPAQRDMLLVDPDDPVGLLYSFIEDPNYKNLGIDLTKEINEGKYHTIDTYHTPLIVSAGKDQELGLYEPFEIDYDVNGDGNVDPGEETAAGFVNGSFEGILGNLAQYKGTFVTNDGNGTTETPSAATIDQLFDNLTNRNRRVGAKR
jgi:prepilin-type N-terminal cleavage/methylation domain-containing protein